MNDTITPISEREHAIWRTGHEQGWNDALTEVERQEAITRKRLPTNAMPKTRQLWEDAVRMIEELANSEVMDERLNARVRLIEALTEIMAFIPREAP